MYTNVNVDDQIADDKFYLTHTDKYKYKKIDLFRDKNLGTYLLKPAHHQSCKQ